MQKVMIALLLVAIIPLVGIAEAKTVGTTQLYKDIWLYGGHRLEIMNNDIVPHSITSDNDTYHAFDSERLLPGQSYSFTPVFDGDYAFHDGYGSGTGILHVRTNETAPTTLTTDKPAYTTEQSMTISGESWDPSFVIHVQIQSPTGQTVQELAVQSTSDGIFSIPWAMPSSLINGEYTISVVDGSTSKSMAVRIDRPIAIDTTNSTISVPTNSTNTNSTSTNSTTTEPAPEPSPPSGGVDTSPLPEPAPVMTNSTIDRAFLLNYAQEQLKFWQMLIQYLNSTAS